MWKIVLQSCQKAFYLSFSHMKTRIEVNINTEEIGLQFGKSYWKICKFVNNPSSKESFLILSIPDVGLHLSVHSPKPPMYPNWHLHLRSKPLDIDEVISEFSQDDLKELASELIDGFGDSVSFCEPSSDETVTVLPPMTDFQKIDRTGGKERTVFNVGGFVQPLCSGTFYRTTVRKIPRLMEEMKRKNPYFDNIIGLSDSGMVMPIDTETMIEINPHMFENLARINRDSLFDPFVRTFDTIQRISPNSLQRWFPTSNMVEFLRETINPLKNSKPQIVDF
jgi:hypothetical protein